jgi:hypothetical protein
MTNSPTGSFADRGRVPAMAGVRYSGHRDLYRRRRRQKSSISGETELIAAIRAGRVPAHLINAEL